MQVSDSTARIHPATFKPPCILHLPGARTHITFISSIVEPSNSSSPMFSAPLLGVFIPSFCGEAFAFRALKGRRVSVVLADGAALIVLIPILILGLWCGDTAIDLRGLARFGVGPFRECVEEASDVREARPSKA